MSEFEKWFVTSKYNDEYYQVTAEAWQAATAESDKRIAELRDQINVLREALKEILFQSESKQIDDIAQKALTSTTAQSLQVHDNEVIERCAKVCESLKNQDYCVDVRAGAEAIRALKGK